MTVAAGTTLYEVLGSLSAELWSVTTLELAVQAGQQHVLSVPETEASVKWDLHNLQDLILVNVGVGDHQQMPEMALVMSLGHWPNLRKLDLSYNCIDDLFLSLTIDCQWLLLEHVVLLETPLKRMVSASCAMQVGHTWLSST